MNHDFDLIVIGSGPAGEKGAAQAAYFGKRVLVVEKEPKPGGAAVHTGTLPSKTLRETAIFLSGHKTGELYGIKVSLDRARAVPRLLSRKDAVVQQEVTRIRDNLSRHNVTYLRGNARFSTPQAIEISGPEESRIVTGEYVLVATGSVPFQPSNMDFGDPDIDDSDTILQIDRMPENLTVLGGGVIGCEYASMFAALGVHVTLIEPRDELLSFLDMEVSEALRVALVRLGVDVLLKTSGNEVKRVGDKIVTTLSTGGSVASDKFLFAAGRSGATASLNLEAMGVRLGKRGYIEVDRWYRTSVPTIFAAGDVVGFPALASTSMEQARVAVCAAFNFQYKTNVSDLLPYGIYTIPEVSCVGLSEEDAKAKGIDVVIGRGMYEDNARGKIIGDHDGMVKLVFERSSRKLIGANCIGDRATEIVHIGQGLILCGGTVDTLIDMVFNYPTLSECYKYAAYDALGKWNMENGGSKTLTMT